MENDSLFITNSTSGDLYELGFFSDGIWNVSEFFDVDEFAEWLQSQTTSDFSIIVPEEVVRNYTSHCPECDMPIGLKPSEDEEDEIFDFECKHCQAFGSIRLEEDEDYDQPWELN
tara:strand:- start:729 stop:1073 length:345 start_codon:yes stop_codon:yes gene_type:complete